MISKRLLWKAYGNALRDAMRTNVSLVKTHPSFMCGWFDGGCYVAAAALLRIFPGDLWGVFVENRKRGTASLWHVVARPVDMDGFLDADGFTSPRAMRTAWRSALATNVWLSPVSQVPCGRWHVMLVGSVDHLSCHFDVPTVLGATRLVSRLESNLRASLPPAPGSLESFKQITMARTA